MNRFPALLITVALFLPINVLAQSYKIDPLGTTIQFKVKNIGIMSVKGVFEKFKGSVDIDDTDLSKSKVDVSIETDSINTGIDMRDKDLRGPDFFHVVKFPAMTFVSTMVETVAGKLKVTGNLTIKGVTKQVPLLVEGPKPLQGDSKRRASATVTINRQDFGISSGATIADEVFISIKTELQP